MMTIELLTQQGIAKLIRPPCLLAVDTVEVTTLTRLSPKVGTKVLKFTVPTLIPCFNPLLTVPVKLTLKLAHALPLVTLKGGNDGLALITSGPPAPAGAPLGRALYFVKISTVAKVVTFVSTYPPPTPTFFYETTQSPKT